MVTAVESLTDQRNVAAWPRSIEAGSAVNWPTAAALAGGAGATGAAAGGGGGAAATGTFFLHPAANMTRKILNKIVALFRLLNSVLPYSNLLPPNRHFVPALRCELLDV